MGVDRLVGASAERREGLGLVLLGGGDAEPGGVGLAAGLVVLGLRDGAGGQELLVARLFARGIGGRALRVLHIDLPGLVAGKLGLELLARVGHLGLAGGDGDVVGGRIQPEQDLPGLDQLAFLDVDLDHPAGDVGRDVDAGGLGIGVVGRFVASAGQQDIGRHDGHHGHPADHQRHAQLRHALGARRSRRLLGGVRRLCARGELVGGWFFQIMCPERLQPRRSRLGGGPPFGNGGSVGACMII